MCLGKSKDDNVLLNTRDKQKEDYAGSDYYHILVSVCLLHLWQLSRPLVERAVLLFLRILYNSPVP